MKIDTLHRPLFTAKCGSEEDYERVFGGSLEWSEQFVKWLTGTERRALAGAANALPAKIPEAAEPGSLVTFRDFPTYQVLFRYWREHAYDVQLKALVKGLEYAMPAVCFRLLKWEELEQRLCGAQDIDVDLLRRHTEYSNGVNKDAPYIGWFWDLLSEFTPSERRKFVEFANGSARLPVDDAGFLAFPRTRMLTKPSRAANRADLSQETIDPALPHADTCFFNIELPTYSSHEVMEQRLRAVIGMDWGMSGDPELRLPAGFAGLGDSEPSQSTTIADALTHAAGLTGDDESSSDDSMPDLSPPDLTDIMAADGEL